MVNPMSRLAFQANSSGVSASYATSLCPCNNVGIPWLQAPGYKCVDPSDVSLPVGENCPYIEPGQKMGRCTGLCPDEIATALLIQKQRRAASSLFMSSLAAVTVTGPEGGNDPVAQYNFVNWNQMSDRAIPHIGTGKVPSHGNSTRTSITRHRPGSTRTGGTGGDVKHGAYQRYINRKKGGVIRKLWAGPAYDLVSNPYAVSGSCLPICP